MLFFRKKPNNTELINGAMKMLTGFDWFDMEIHYPEKLIDICLSISPQSEGCGYCRYYLCTISVIEGN